MPILTDEPNNTAVRNRAQRVTLERFERVPVPKREMIRPIEGICRQCVQREPVGTGRYCAPCLELMERNDPLGSELRYRTQVFFALLAGALLLLVVFGLAHDAGNGLKRTDSTVIQTK